MSDFNLLSQLGNKVEPRREPQAKIQYQQYFIECEGKETAILVPLRECDLFEESMASYDGTKQEFRALLRKHRAVRD